MSSNTFIKLQSSDNVEITVERVVAERSNVIKDMLDDLGDKALDRAIPLTEVNLQVLTKVLEWCHHHREDEPVPAGEDANTISNMALDEWDVRFLQVEQEMLFRIILAANYLDIKKLLDMGCRVVANMIKGKEPKEIRETFGIENKLTAGQEESIRRQ